MRSRFCNARQSFLDERQGAVEAPPFGVEFGEEARKAWRKDQPPVRDPRARLAKDRCSGLHIAEPPPRTTLNGFASGNVEGKTTLTAQSEKRARRVASGSPRMAS
jgi:hypothetical protein